MVDISFNVIDTLNQPVAAARITLSNGPGGAAYGPFITDSNGHVVNSSGIPSVSILAGTYTVLTVAVGYQTRSLLGAFNSSQIFNIVLTPTSGPL